MRIGLLAAARITGPAVVTPAALVEGVEITAVAARSLDRARAAAAEWGIATAYGSYQELIDDPDLDAIYVASPAALHRRWSVAALRAGKHVLCEKPLAANADDARAMVAAAEESGRLLMEAFHWRYHPLVAQARAILDSGRLGELRTVDARFNLPDGEILRTDIRWDLSIGGGALMDLGCYPVQWIRWVVGIDPTVMSATAQCHVPDIDGSLAASLAWTSGVSGSIECSMIADGPGVVDLVITGSEGTLSITNPLAPHMGAAMSISTADGETTEIAIDGLDTSTYFHQLVAFRDAVATGVAPLTGGADSIATMELIDACYRAAGLQPRPTHPD